MMNNQYKEELDQVRLTESARQQLTARLAQPITNGGKPRRGLSRAAACILAACIVGLTVCAAAVCSETLRGYFGREAIPVYDENRQLLNLSQTVNGWQLTLTDCICDANELYIGITVQAPPEVNLQAVTLWRDPALKQYVEEATRYDFLETSVDVINREGGMAWHVEMLPDDNPEDQVLYFALVASGGGLSSSPKAHGFNGSTLHISLGNLCHNDDWNETPRMINNSWRPYGWFQRITDQPDTWTFRNVKINCPDVTRQIAINRTVPMYDGTATLVSAGLSPLTLTLHFEGGAIYDHHKREMLWNKDGLCMTVPPVTLWFQDGTALEFDTYGTFDGVPLHYASGAGSWCDQDSGSMSVCVSFGRLVDIEKIDYITMGNLVLPSS